MLVFHVAGTVPTPWFFRYLATLLPESGAHYVSGVRSPENYKNYIVGRLSSGTQTSEVATHMLSGGGIGTVVTTA